MDILKIIGEQLEQDRARAIKEAELAIINRIQDFVLYSVVDMSTIAEEHKIGFKGGHNQMQARIRDYVADLKSEIKRGN